MRTTTEYDENYPTCSYTHAWLRIMHEELSSEEVTKLLGIEPSDIVKKGTPVSKRSSKSKINKLSGWFLESEHTVNSLDARHHIDWILGQINDKTEEITELKKRGYLIDICCRWDSNGNSGGPTLSPQEMLFIGKLGIELWFDIYFENDNV